MATKHTWHKQWHAIRTIALLIARPAVRAFGRSYDVRQLMTLVLVLLLIHPAVLHISPLRAQERPKAPVREPSKGRGRTIPGPSLAPQQAVMRPSPTTWRHLPGQTETLLPDGQTLYLGGTSGVAPSALAALRQQGKSRVVTLPNHLLHPRAWHTATLLPDGSVFVFGGLNQGTLVPDTEVYDPATQRFLAVSIPVPTARAGHSATVLTDGRVLLVGGVGSNGALLGTLELWDSTTGTIVTLGPRLTTPRRGHAATLRADGTVLIHGGESLNGVPADEIYDPVTQTLAEAMADDPQPEQTVRLAVSVPADGAQATPIQKWIVLRFATPMDVTTLNANTVVLSDENPVPARVVPLENGMLVFVTSQDPLKFETNYTLTVSAAHNSNGFPALSKNMTVPAF